MLTITITGDAGEGKTTLLGMIGRYLAFLGYVVTLIDARDDQEPVYLKPEKVRRPLTWTPGRPVTVETVQ